MEPPMGSHGRGQRVLISSLDWPAGNHSDLRDGRESLRFTGELFRRRERVQERHASKQK